MSDERCKHGHVYAECGGCGWEQIDARLEAWHERQAQQEADRKAERERVLSLLRWARSA